MVYRIKPDYRVGVWLVLLVGLGGSYAEARLQENDPITGLSTSILSPG